MVSQSVQTSYQINPELGFPGDLARPNEPHSLDSGTLHVPTGATRKPRPGDALYYDTGQNKFAIPTSAAQVQNVVGLLHYRKDRVQNVNSTLEFENNAEIEVAIFGTFWVVAGSAIAYDARIDWDHQDFKWDPAPELSLPNGYGAATVKAAIEAALGRVPIVCATRGGASTDGQIIEARIGYGHLR